MNWQAIGIGAAVGVVLGLAWQTGVQALVTQDPSAWDWLKWISYAFNIFVDLAVGATAGWIAAQRGAAHGALADIASIVAGFAIGVVMQLARKQGFEYLGHAEYWTSWVVMVVPGIALAAFAGWAAALLSRSRPGKGAATPS
jgi:hypothetical protein